MFAPEFGITEDPATGIASGPLGAYLVHHGLVTEGGPHEGRVDIVSRQGVAMGRPSRIHISIEVANGVIAGVKVGGQAVLVARGEFLV
jgi:trans-2,3-dihydro-3-hydroxyanthranilate isomerase